MTNKQTNQAMKQITSKKKQNKINMLLTNLIFNIMQTLGR